MHPPHINFETRGGTDRLGLLWSTGPLRSITSAPIGRLPYWGQITPPRPTRPALHNPIAPAPKSPHPASTSPPSVIPERQTCPGTAAVSLGPSVLGAAGAPVDLKTVKGHRVGELRPGASRPHRRRPGLLWHHQGSNGILFNTPARVLLLNPMYPTVAQFNVPAG